MTGFKDHFSSVAAGYADFRPVYQPALDPYLRLDDTVAVGSALHKDNCDFWDGLL